MSYSYGALEGTLKSAKSQNVEKANEKDTESVKGLSLFSATLFIAGEMAGSGVLALPRAVVNTGYIGILLLVFFCINAAYGGVRLGNCWNIIEQRYPEHRIDTRNPYSVIALRAVGKFGSSLVSHCIRFTLFGAGTVYLLLSSQIIQALIGNVLSNVSSCSYFFVIALCVILPMWLGSPKEFSLVGWGAILSSIIACILFTIQIALDARDNIRTVKHNIHGFHDFFLSFGTLLFAFGGASTFPTIQNDMRNKKQFSSSVTIAFIIIMILYVPITVGGFFVYGEEVSANVTLSLSASLLVHIGNILMAIHLVFAFLIVMNPVCQDVEETFDIPKDFNWKRCLIRTIIVLLMIIVGESVPQFGKILSLVGGSTITLLTFVFPPLFYMKLCDKISPNWEKRFIPLYERVYIWELIIIGIVGGFVSTFSAINDIFGDSFTTPCYWIK
ncbi:amino acid transporter AVT1J-like [Anoplophora glabripennis]|uniref:amino acid transporter AVT1J-like n=1 Tax=Anoplophora glabripennis TaxID=217634 RepID=UPI000874C520|nr:amino acid transporter AVT1J-like [Anoplophora glabripennis]